MTPRLGLGNARVEVGGGGGKLGTGEVQNGVSSRDPTRGPARSSNLQQPLLLLARLRISQNRLDRLVLAPLVERRGGYESTVAELDL